MVRRPPTEVPGEFFKRAGAVHHVHGLMGGQDLSLARFALQALVATAGGLSVIRGTPKEWSA